MPTTIPKDLCCGEIKALVKEVDFLFPIQEEWVPEFESKAFAVDAISGDSDYFFTVEKLKHLPGRHLSSRRNLLKQFNEHYPEHILKPLDPTTKADALKILDKWRTEVEEPGDYLNCKEALELYEQLKLTGYVTYADPSTPAGFAIGEPLNQITFVIHFAKGLKEYKGIYPYLYSSFASTLENQFQWINLEQDLGIPSLSQAKHAYEPDLILPKLRLQCSLSHT